MITPFFMVVTGLVLFLFAMVHVTETVRRSVTSTRTRELFGYAVRTPLWGVVTGFLLTVLFQSSTATTALTVGLVSAGLMSFFHSLGVIIGADIGTTITVQLVVWRVTDLSPLFVIAGAFLWVTGKGKLKPLGEGIFYFGLMFFGLTIVSHAMEPLKESPAILQFFHETVSPLTGVLIGCGFTVLVQSSAIPIALLVILAGHGMLSLEAALPFVIGANLGTAFTAVIVFTALAANAEGRRVVLSHVFFKFVGAVVCLAAFPLFLAVLKNLSSSVSQQIALGHIIFNVLVAFIFIPTLPWFAHLARVLYPKRGEIFSLWPDFLDERLLGNAELALEAARKEMEREMVLARRMYLLAAGLIDCFQSGNLQTVGHIENVVNSLKWEIGIFLRRVSEGLLTRSTSKQLLLYSSLVDDIERIADHSTNISELAEIKSRKMVCFSEFADNDLAEIRSLVTANLDDALSLMGTYSQTTMEAIFAREEQIDKLVANAKLNHLERVCSKICQAESGPIYLGVLVNQERISDHCENIAEYFRDLNVEEA
ncbi:MAG: Na/Pi cotransporter family protein [Syntrophales bacterium]|jgi:phosphate:Na+ symporter|nr:Na/Pi cotransporter family protein [Syntrophales bacterium]MCK9527913.1 Na/Pi cotransporter family protein [Syntrophales bacterium]MDX9921911.1 Na/Pi cotransporter family protein [Syntrophales bacterium]